MNDWSLLRNYVETGSEASFAALVQQNLDLVYSTALRRLGNPNDAEEVTQVVFSVLAQKAYSLKPTTSLTGWLYRSTCLEAMKWWRNEYRRRKRETEAASMTANLPNPSEDSIWEQILPCLDDAMLQISDKDRLAILLRYFQHKSLAEVGQALNLREDAARMRIGRALEQLRGFLLKKGVVCTPVALAMLINEQAVHAAPTSTKATIVHSVETMIKSASVPSLVTLFITYLEKQGLQLKVAGAGMALLIAIFAFQILKVGHLTSTGSRSSQTIIEAKSPGNPGMAAQEDSGPVDAAQNLVTIEGVVTVLPNDPSTNAPKVHLAASGARYTLIFPMAEQIKRIVSSNLYRVQGTAAKVPPVESPEPVLEVSNVNLIKVYTDTDRRLLEAADLKDYAKIKELLEKGADVNVRSVSFGTPFHELLKDGQPESLLEYSYHAKLLIDHGANIHALDENGFSPLHMAACQGHTTTAVILLALGADWTLRASGGETPLDLAWDEATRKAMILARPNEEPPYNVNRPDNLNKPDRVDRPSPVPPPILASVKHRAVRDFLNSPARDSTECRVMLQKLLEKGYSIEHLRRVYSAACTIRYADPAYNQIFDGLTGKLRRTDTPSLARLREMRKSEALYTLSQDQHNYDSKLNEPKIDNKELLNELLDIRPKVGYGPGNNMRFDPKTERELGDEDVINYIKSHPIYDPPFKMTSELSKQEIDQAEAKMQAGQQMNKNIDQRMGRSQSQLDEYYRLKEEDLRNQGLTNQLEELYQMKNADRRFRRPF